MDEALSNHILTIWIAAMFGISSRKEQKSAVIMQALDVHKSADSTDYTLTLAQAPIPVPQGDEVLIKVAYAGVNRADSVQAQGRYPLPEGANPRLGLEVSGHIAALGDQVVGWSKGEAVAALTDGGGYAEYVVVPAAYLLAVPMKLSLADMASIPEAAAASWMALHEKGQLKQGETVLIQGASGNIGLFMVQLARAWGAKVLATASSAEKCAQLTKLGAIAINYTQEDLYEAVMAATNKQGVDVIIDPLGASAAQMHLSLLRFGGRLVTIGFMGGNKLEGLKLAALLMRSLSWHAFGLRSQPQAVKADIMANTRQKLLPLVTIGKIIPIIDSVFAMDQADKAHARMQERLHCGKILLEVQPS
jgi:putative PIG3 family NAD(P)H quinone oxidoreductase